MFLAALDHMDYFSNPEVELNRMTISIKAHLKNEEKKIKEEDGKARQQRLEVVNELISQENTTKLSIKNDIVAQKEILKKLEAKLVDVESSILQLQTEKEKLIGSNNVPGKPKPGQENNWTFLKIIKTPGSSGTFHSDSISKLKTVGIICFICLIGVIVVQQYSELNRSRTKYEKFALLQDSIARADSIKHEIAIQDSINRAEEKEDSLNFRNGKTTLRVKKYEFISNDLICLYLESSVELKGVSYVNGRVQFPQCSTKHEIKGTDIENKGSVIICNLRVNSHNGDYSQISIDSLNIKCSYGSRTLYNLGTYNDSARN